MFELYIGASNPEYKKFVFSGGEVSVKIDFEKNRQALVGTNNPTYIKGNLESSEDIFELMLLVDAVRRSVGPNTKIDLTIPYFPYARQDRVMVPGESLSVKVMADLINSLKVDALTIWDAHSDVTPALLNNCKNVEQKSLVSRFNEYWKRFPDLTLVAPDAGAIKKTMKIAEFNSIPMVRADKLRDVKTGAILETIVYTDHIGKGDFLIVDDICDGGRTFIELAKVLRKKTGGNIFLYVTHGIFSQGLDVFQGCIDRIYCPNVFSKVPENPILVRQ